MTSKGLLAAAADGIGEEAALAAVIIAGPEPRRRSVPLARFAPPRACEFGWDRRRARATREDAWR